MVEKIESVFRLSSHLILPTIYKVRYSYSPQFEDKKRKAVATRSGSNS